MLEVRGLYLRSGQGMGFVEVWYSQVSTHDMIPVGDSGY